MGRINLHRVRTVFDEIKSVKELNKPSKLFLKGIMKRWLINVFGIILIILIILEICLVAFANYFFYSEVYRSINDRANEITNFLNKYSIAETSEFNDAAISYLRNFPEKKHMEIEIFDYKDNVVAMSTRLMQNHFNVIIDDEMAENSTSYDGFWSGKTSSGEKIVMVKKAIYNDGSYIGAVRCIVSLESAEWAIFLTILAGIIIAMFIIICIIISSLYFIRSIVNPMREIGFTARKIAEGNFDTKIEKKYDDEIGELCDTINYMAGELNASEKIQNDFLSSVSHELRTPLTAIKGWAETIKMDTKSDPETMERGMQVIIRESERLCGIVEELLSFSRMQSGRMVLLMEKMDILAELTEAVYMFKDRAKTENKYLLYSEPHSIAPVLGDKNRLKQVFINVIDNALKYTDSGGAVSVNIVTKEEEVSISINDNGCGIPAIHLPYVKDKFYKANQTKRGSGIGLAIADEIVHLHKGHLDIKSEEGVGTTVEIRIPIAEMFEKANQDSCVEENE